MGNAGTPTTRADPPYRRLIQQPAGEILYVGDHVGKDIRPAKAVGLQTGLMWSQSNEADYSFDRFEDVLALFTGSVID